MSDTLKKMLEHQNAAQKMLDEQAAVRKMLNPYNAIREIDALHPTFKAASGLEAYATSPTTSSLLMESISRAATAQSDLERAMQPSSIALAYEATEKARAEWEKLTTRTSSATQYFLEAYETAAKSRLEWEKLTAPNTLIAQHVLEASERTTQAQNALYLGAGLDARSSAFRYPDPGEIASLARLAMEADPLASKSFASVSELQLRMEAMKHAWLGADPLSSARGFAAMQSMGSALDRLDPFASDLVTGLRTNLGDWRDLVTPTVPAILDAEFRSGFYMDRGFNPVVGSFSERAFVNSAELAGLTSLPRERKQDEDVDELEICFQRNKEAYEELLRFEVVMRRCIDKAMRSAFGDKWMKQNVPSEIYQSWRDKRDKAVKAGEEERRLIEYADFSDYRIIIERNDNWNGVFKHVFARREDVRESLQRLQPVRITTMHSRFITLDDEALLIVETKRLLKAVKKYLQ